MRQMTAMRTARQIPESILEAMVGLIVPFCPNMDVTSLRRILREVLENGSDSRFVPDSALSKRETASVLNVSLSTVDRMLRDRQLPHTKVRGSVRIPVRAVEELLESSE